MYFRLSWIILFALFSSENAYAQPHRLDSLKRELKNHPENDTSKVLLIYDIAFSSFQVDLPTSKKYLLRTKELSDSLDFVRGKAKAAYLSGILASRESKIDESLEFFKLSMEYHRSINNKKGVAAIHTAFGITHFMNSEFKKALKEYYKSLAIYEELGIEDEGAQTMSNIANVHLEIGEYDKAISIRKKALKMHQRNNDELSMTTCLHSLGWIYKLQGNYPLAIENYNKSLELFVKYKDSSSIASVYNTFGDIYSLMNQYEKALQYHKKSIEIASKIGKTKEIALNYNNIGSVYSSMNQYERAIEYFEKSLEFSEKNGFITQIAMSNLNIGSARIKLNETGLARERLLKAIEISDSIDHRRFLGASLVQLGHSYLIDKKYSKALSFILRGKEILDELELLDLQKITNKYLSETYDGLGMYEQALEAYQEYKVLSDSLFNEENLDEIARIEYEYKYKQQLDSANIRELKLSKEVLLTNEDLEASKQRNLWAVITILGLILVAGGIIVFLRLRNLNAKTQNIQMEQKLLRSQMTPHFIFNSLSVLQGMILNKEEKKSVSYLSKFSKLLRLTLENSRDKEVLLKDELDAVRNYLALQNLENNSYQFEVVLDENIQEERFKIPPMLIQPFIENSIEHAFSNQQEDKHIKVQMNLNNNQLVCQIIDNGIGIDSSNRDKNVSKNSLSTTISKERLDLLSKHYKMSGSVSIEDRNKYNEKGTIVTLVIPYKIED